MSAAADPSPTAAKTAPKPAGPRSNRCRISAPIAGSPNVIIENAACEATARTRIVRCRLMGVTLADDLLRTAIWPC
jgi:hypothetical protein